jgi:hypothetical protein
MGKRRTLVILGALIALGTATVLLVDDRVTVAEMKDKVDRELAIGASAEQIEQFFGRHGLRYRYHRYLEDYYIAVISDVSRYPVVDKSIHILIYVDTGRRLSRTEIYATYGGL